MNIRDLTYLLAVHDLQHFGKAAEATCISQPALSMQLKKLETELGVQLFERGNRRVMTTPIGQEVVKLARDIVTDVKTMKALAKAAEAPFAGTMTIGAFPTLAPYFFPHVIPKLNKKFPDLTLLLVEEKTDVLMSKLLEGELDAAFLALPIEHVALSQRLLFSDPFYLAVPRDHALAKRKRVTAQHLENETILLLNEGHCLREQALSFCALASAQENASFRATSLETLRQMIASGIGITLIPEIAMQKNDGICYIPFTKPAPVRQIGLVWRKNSPRAPCINAIADFILLNTV